jgi:hypothetical protein
MNTQKHIWEGWIVQDFIDALEHNLDMIMSNNSHQRPFTSKAELKAWCKDHQPYYKKHIPEVVTYFSKKYKLK